MITVAGAHDQQLVPCYAASVFMSFQQIGITLVLMIVLITVMVAVSSSIATQVGKVLGVGNTGVTIWNLAKIPVVFVIVSVMFGFLYKTAPNVKQPGA